MMPGSRFARIVMIVVAVLVALGLILSAIAVPASF
jgi:putative copper export protein